MLVSNFKRNMVYSNTHHVPLEQKPQQGMGEDKKKKWNHLANTEDELIASLSGSLFS